MNVSGVPPIGVDRDKKTKKIVSKLLRGVLQKLYHCTYTCVRVLRLMSPTSLSSDFVLTCIREALLPLYRRW